jgi:hypothetical protein
VSDNLRVLVDGCCSATSFIASLSQIRGRPRRCSSSKFNCHPQTAQTTAAPYVHSQHLRLQNRVSFAAAAAYSLVSNNV